ncbi:hypothetical protein PARPLA_02650 [Rhodobacteraceae bacterium THAF1]|uniref:hypothetical protein n=1 Tax=Palleronia sp. THAF1 TaxID=2587842 RepID=UPI000F3BE998|nr:hypothetical protein [Palleronia sp. THAF1]QFU08128.1 hypothetical protein FIU81_05525 [Palleronia sp. THAF1]VDC27995.1 hypothetical protein PARPLA_02650 [Rhodobacteraceae bacterium THAF1]
MTRSIRTATAIALTVAIVAVSGMTLGAVADAKAFPSGNTHATPEMQANFPDLF